MRDREPGHMRMTGEKRVEQKKESPLHVHLKDNERKLAFSVVEQSGYCEP